MSKNTTPKISVIVPVYKVEQYLSKCIDSILAQTFTDFELLLINDGSPDRSGAICDEYAAKDSRIRVFHKENGGVSSARNVGLDNASGEWIVFVDADDWVKHDYFENIIVIAQEHSPDIIQIQFTKDSNSFNRENKHNVTVFTSLDSYINKKNRAYTCCSYVFKKENIKGLRFTRGIRLGEDQEFSVKALLYSKKIAHTDDIFYFYYYRETSAMNSEIKYTDLDGIRMIREINVFVEKFDLTENKKFLQSVFRARTISYILFLCRLPFNDPIFKIAYKEFKALSSIKNKFFPLLLHIAIWNIKIPVWLYKIKKQLHDK